MTKLQLTKKYEKYPEYKDSGVEWVGKIPVSWQMSGSRRVFSTKKDRVGTGFAEYKVLSLTLGGVVPRVLDGSGKNPAEYDTYQVFKKGDIVFCLFDYDVTPRTIGIAEEDGMMTGAYTRLIPNPGICGKYFYYYFLSLDYNKELLHLCTGLRNSLSKQVFWSMKSPLPSHDEQEKIAKYLDEKTALIDAIIEKKQRLIELLQEKRTAVINHTVTKGLDPNVELVDSGVEWIGKIPNGWEVRRVKELFEIKRGRVIAKEEMNEEAEFPVYSSQTKDNGCMGYINTYDFDQSALTWTTDGANAGTVFLREGKFNCTNVCGILVSRKKMYLNYFAYSVQVSATPNKRLDTNGYKIMSNEMRSISVVVPPVPQQEIIALYVDQATKNNDRAIYTLENSIWLLNEFKSSLISITVTGKIKV